MARDTKVGILITGDSKGAVQAINLTTKEVQELEKVTSKATQSVKKDTDSVSKGFSQTAKTAGQLGTAIVAMGVAFGAMAMRKIIQETSESEAVMAQLNATLKATGGAAGKTAEGLSNTATELQKTTTYTDEAIISVETLLLQFKNIKGDAFDEATRSVLDMATAMKMDASSAAKIIGKALDDPAKALIRLTKYGVSFTDSQKETVKALMEVGRVSEAQAIIQEELRRTFEGSAEAARGTLGGALTGLQNAFNDLFEVSTGATSGMTESINKLAATLSDPAIKQSLGDLVSGLISATNWAVQLAAAMNWAYGTGGEQNTLGYKMAELDRLTAALKDATSGRTVDMKAAADLKKEIAALSKEIDAQVKSINGVSNAQKDEVKTTTATTAATKANTVAKKEGTVTGLKSVATLEKEAKVTAKLSKDKDDLRKKLVAIGQENLKEKTAVDELIASLKFEAEQLTRTAREQEIYNTLSKAGTAITEESRAEIIKLAGAQYDARTAIEKTAKATEEAARQQEQLWSHLTTSMSDIFTQMVVDGKSSFDTINDGFSAMVKKMLAEATFNEVVIGFGGTAANGQNSQNSTMNSRLTNAAATYGISELISAAFKGFTGSKEDLQGDPIAKSINKLADLSFKPIEWLTGKSFNDLFGQKNDGNNNAVADFNLATGKITGRTWGNSGGDVNAVTSLVEPLLQIAQAIGGSSLVGSVQLGTKGIQYGGMNFGQNAQAFYDKAIKDVIEGATKLSTTLKSLLKTFDGTTEDLMRFASAVSSIEEQSKLSSVTLAIKDFAAAQKTSLQAYGANTKALFEQIRTFDGTADAAERLNSALFDNKAAAYEFVTVLKSVGAALTDVAKDQADSIRESVLSEEDLRAKRLAERNSLRASLSTITDPAKAEETAKRILELNQQLFDNLTEEQQAFGAEYFAKYAESTSTAANTILNKTINSLSATQADINNKVSEMLRNAAASQQKAADTMIVAADRFYSTVSRLTQTVINIGQEISQ